MSKINWEELNEKVANMKPRRKGSSQLTFREIEEIKEKVWWEEYDVPGGIVKLAEEYNCPKGLVSRYKTMTAQGKGWKG